MELTINKPANLPQLVFVNNLDTAAVHSDNTLGNKHGKRPYSVGGGHVRQVGQIFPRQVHIDGGPSSSNP